MSAPSATATAHAPQGPPPTAVLALQEVAIAAVEEEEHIHRAHPRTTRTTDEAHLVEATARAAMTIVVVALLATTMPPAAATTALLARVALLVVVHPSMTDTVVLLAVVAAILMMLMARLPLVVEQDRMMIRMSMAEVMAVVMVVAVPLMRDRLVEGVELLLLDQAMKEDMSVEAGTGKALFFFLTSLHCPISFLAARWQLFLPSPFLRMASYPGRITPVHSSTRTTVCD